MAMFVPNDLKDIFSGVWNRFSALLGLKNYECRYEHATDYNKRLKLLAVVNRFFRYKI